MLIVISREFVCAKNNEDLSLKNVFKFSQNWIHPMR